MSKNLPLRELIAKARERLPLPELLARFGLGDRAKKSAHCPFHEDGHKSFSVWKDGSGRWGWKCHAGCGKGDEITFVERQEKLSRHDAVQRFLDLAGLNSATPPQPEKATPKSEQPKPQSTRPFYWRSCVLAFRDKYVEQIANWRGFPLDFVKELRAMGVIGIHRCYGKKLIAFPVANAEDEVVGMHGRTIGRPGQTKDGKPWVYDPKGVKSAPLVIGKLTDHVHIFESTWDALAFMFVTAVRDGIIITRGAGNGALVAGLIQDRKPVFVWLQNDKPDAKTGIVPAEKWTADVCAHLPKKCVVKRVKVPEPHEDLNGWQKAGATPDDLKAAMANAERIELPPVEVDKDAEVKRLAALSDIEYEGQRREVAKKFGWRVQTLDQKVKAERNRSRTTTKPRREESIQALLESDLPKIQLPGDNRLLSAFASDLGEILKDHDIYQRGGVAMIVNDERDGLEPITPAMLRTLAERNLVCYRITDVAEGRTAKFLKTMSIDAAQGVLSAKQFLSHLPKVNRIATTRLPIMRANGAIELLPNGYDAQSMTLTLSQCEYDETLSVKEAIERIDDLLSEFPFADAGRSKAVAIAAMVGLYAALLVDRKTLRPVFIYLANAEGAGKTLLAICAITPTHGEAKIDSKLEDQTETKKELLAAVIEARPYILFDNFKGHLNSPALEGFTTSTRFSGRILGVSKMFVGDNDMTVLVTGNGMSITPDMRRRSLPVELRMEAERAEDRVFRHEFRSAGVTRKAFADSRCTLDAGSRVGRFRATRPEPVALCFPRMEQDHWRDRRICWLRLPVCTRRDRRRWRHRGRRYA